MEGWGNTAGGMGRMLERKTLCMSGEPGSTTHNGDRGFADRVRATFSPAESNAAERVVLLKRRLRTLPEDQFWYALTRELAAILGAQYTLVSKKVLPEQVFAADELPEAGAPEACCSNLAFYFTGAEDKPERMAAGFEYPVRDSLSAHMKHDKALLVPAHLASFVGEQVQDFEVPVESHFAIPLMHEDECHGHVGVYWSVAGEQARSLSWGMVEMVLHAVEDICIQRLLANRTLHPIIEVNQYRNPTTKGVLAASFQSLKPYARSLSHELRTPMHGVVGMLDIMQVSVQDALESHCNDPSLVEVLRTLRENIETIQDSSRRAVEAADNIVHAYDFDMQVPGPTGSNPEATAAVVERSVEPLDEAEIAAATASAGQKRRRSNSTDLGRPLRSPKHRILDGRDKELTPHTAVLKSIVKESCEITSSHAPVELEAMQADSAIPSPSTPGTKLTRVREIMQVVVNESLRFGGRPDSAIAQETATGEHIEVRNVGSNGDRSLKMVEWSVDPSVPEEILIDERDFAKLVSVLFLNALKFTEEGSVQLRATLSPRSRFVVVKVTDTGAGIPAAFRPYLFKAFSRGDDSLTRQNEGLGLGLLVAKGLARRVGGDLVCVRSETEGPRRGSEFELRIPLTPASGSSRSSTPSRTPTPLRRDQSETPGAAAVEAVPEPEARSLQPEGDDDPARLITSSLPSPQLGPAAVPAQPAGLGRTATPRRRSQTTTMQPAAPDRNLARRFPLNVMVAEDNRINRKLLVNMLHKLGYTQVHEAFDGSEAVRLMEMDSVKPAERHIDVILMDLWMPNMDGYEATKRIMQMQRLRNGSVARPVKILAVTADVTDVALDRARAVGMQGIMTKPYKMVDLERLIVEYCPQKVVPV